MREFEVNPLIWSLHFIYLHRDQSSDLNLFEDFSPHMFATYCGNRLIYYQSRCVDWNRIVGLSISLLPPLSLYPFSSLSLFYHLVYLSPFFPVSSLSLSHPFYLSLPLYLSLSAICLFSYVFFLAEEYIYLLSKHLIEMKILVLI